MGIPISGGLHNNYLLPCIRTYFFQEAISIRYVNYCHDMNPRAELDCLVPTVLHGAGTFLITRFPKLNVFYCCKVKLFSPS